MNKTLTIFLIFISFVILSKSAYAWSTLTNDIDINCAQINESLNCDYRTLTANNASSINAESGNKVLPVLNEHSYPGDSDITTILFLIDTSDPARQNVIEKNKEQVKKLISSAKPHHKLGLATFDKRLNIISPVGTSSFLISKSLPDIKAKGKTTELYRNLIQAIETLHAFDAQRKVIFLLSDGQAEDKAYFHSDVIKAARKSGVIINSIGYPRSITLSVALQTIRRLSEETGGNYTETDISYNLPDTYIKSAFSNIDNGGSFSIDLRKAQSDKIKLNFKVANKSKSLSIPVKTKPIQQKAGVESVQAKPLENKGTTPSTNSNIPVQIVTKQVEQQPVNLWLWYGLPAAFIIIVIFILVVLFLLWNRESRSKDNDSTSEYKPYAYLVAQDEINTRYPVTRTICRIGRSKENELTLDDTSVSRRHAEIHRNTNGTFDIIDMNSMNGVYVNNEKVGKAILQEGDTIEIGDIFLTFTQFASDFSLEESTVMQKTKTPSLN